MNANRKKICVLVVIIVVLIIVILLLLSSCEKDKGGDTSLVDTSYIAKADEADKDKESKTEPKGEDNPQKEPSGTSVNAATPTENQSQGEAPSGTQTSQPTEKPSEQTSQQKPSQGAQSTPGVIVTPPKSEEGATPAAPSNPKPATDPKPVTPASPEPTHTHTWVPVTTVVHHDAEYETIHHDAVVEQVWVVDKAAWTEEISEEIVEWHEQCDACGAIMDSWTQEEIGPHMRNHALAGQSTTHGNRPVVVGYNTTTVNHPEEGHYENKVVKAAYDEQKLVKNAYDETVTTGYKCSCGETKG